MCLSLDIDVKPTNEPRISIEKTTVRVNIETIPETSTNTRIDYSYIIRRWNRETCLSHNIVKLWKFKVSQTSLENHWDSEYLKIIL